MLLKKKGEEIKAVEMPPIKEYLKEIQRDGSELGADEVLKETLGWLKSCGKRNAVSSQTVSSMHFLLLDGYTLSGLSQSLAADTALCAATPPVR